MRREDAPEGLGRHKTLKGLKNGLPNVGCRSHWLSLRAPSNRLLAFVLGATRWIRAALCGRILPLQSVLALQGRFETSPFLATLAGINGRGASSPVIYVDGVRLAQPGVAMWRRVGGRLIIDFDDLMSRRVARMARNHEDISFGAFAAAVPGHIQTFIRALGPLRAILLGWEKRLLRQAELEAARTADAIAFTSAYESRLFRRFQRRHASEADPVYLVLGPSTRHIKNRASDILRRQPPTDVRFIFVGSDVLEQNRVAIQEIVDLARDGALAAPAYIYGRMTRKYEPPDNVVFCGFAETLAQVYQPGSILLLARSVRGGIKSKVLEACEHGVPTVGVSSALEGFEGAYPWRVDGAALRRLVGDASELRRGYHAAVAAGVAICAARFSSRRYWEVVSSYVRSGADGRGQEGI